jgi:rhamnosyltransferase
MIPSNVLAVVVSYNGLQKIRQTVVALRKQLAHIYIVDNGSEAESLAVLASLERMPGVMVERLGENRGVGYALNRGVQHAREMGCNWLLTMDQDSVVDSSFIAAYGAALENEPELVCLAPRIMDRTRKKDAAGGAISYAITSGNLVRLSVFDQIGLYDESFFIDAIDFDFCLRARRSGYVIRRVAEAHLQHQLGDSVELPRLVRDYYARHPPIRRYYMYRNFMYLVERHLFQFPGFIAKLGISQLVLLFLIGFLDASPLVSYRGVIRGLWDYVMRRRGPYLQYGRRTLLKAV